MSEMLEKVARAIRDNIKVDATGMAPVIASAYIVGIEEAAIAAVEAMREPDEEMIAAGTRSIMAHGRVSNAVCNAWRNMCRSILSTPTTRGEVK